MVPSGDHDDWDPKTFVRSKKKMKRRWDFIWTSVSARWGLPQHDHGTLLGVVAGGYTPRRGQRMILKSHSWVGATD